MVGGLENGGEVCVDELGLRKEGFRVMPNVTMPSGVYVLMREGVVLYVGKSKNVYDRLAKHEATRRRTRRTAFEFNVSSGISQKVPIPFNHVLVKFCMPNEAEVLETELIWKLRPKYNTTVLEPTPPAGVDLEALAKLAGVEWTENEPWERSSKDWRKPNQRAFTPGGKRKES